MKRSGRVNTKGVFKDGLTVTIDNRIIVTQENAALTLGGVIDATKEYYISGIIDMTGITIEVPVGQMLITGAGGDVAKLICNDDNYTMFNSPVGGGGTLNQAGIGITVDGVNSKVYELVSNNGFAVFGATNLLWQNCTSLGSLDNFFQGLENITTRVGGTPELELIGNWMRGYFVNTGNGFGYDAGTFSLYKAGAGLVFNSRFRTNQNITLNTDNIFCDFSGSNFANPSTLQFENLIISRNGVFNSADPLITPNISSMDLASYWKGCVGVSNTHIGGQTTVSTEIETPIAVSGTYYEVLGTFTTSDLEHFDSPAEGRLRHLGNTPIEYKITAKYDMDGDSNSELSLRLRKYDFALDTTTTICQQLKVVNNFQGGRDVAFFDIYCSVTLNENDYVFPEIANLSGTDNATAENGSFIDVEER